MMYKILTVTALSGSMMLGATAYAQDAQDGGSNDIIVTAEKRESRLLDVSAPISVIGSEQIEKHTVTNFEELVEQIPGVSVTSDFGGSASKVISIRGVGGADDYRPNGSPSVAMHVDNIYQSSNAFLTMPFFDVERVEVLKGPQGTLYGRNSTAGVINVISRTKADTLNGYVNAQYESYDRVRFEGALGMPLAEGVGLRIAAVADQGGGFQDGKGAGVLAGYRPAAGVPAIANPGMQEGWGDRDLLAGRATLNADFSPDSKLTVRLFGSRDRGETQYPDSRGGVSNSGFVEPDDDPYTFYSDRYGRRRMDTWGANANFSQQLGSGIVLDLVGGYQDGKRYVEGEGTGSPIRIFDYNFSDRVKQVSGEARLSRHDGSRFEWVIGGYYLNDKVDFRTDLLAADAYRSNLVSDYHQKRESVAAFGQGDFNVTERLKLSLGLRYTADNASYVGSTYDANPWGVSIVPLAMPALPILFDEDYDEDNVSGRATISYKPTDTLNLWVSAGKGYKAGGFDGSTIFSEPEALPFRSETVWAYEGGLKFAGPGGLFLNVDGFYYDFSDLQANSTTIVAGAATTANVRTNVAAARMYGVDIAGGATLVRSGPHELTASLGATLIDSKITEFDSSDPNVVAVNLGNEMPAAPKFSGNAQVAYTYRGNGWKLGGMVWGSRKGSEFKRLNNAVSARVPGYWLLNARIDLELENPGITLFAFGRNLTDEVYYVDYSATARLTGSPRVFGGGLRFDF